MIVTGGQLHQMASLVGPFARATIEQLRVACLFFSVTGISDGLDLTGPSEFDAEMKAAMMSISRRAIPVANGAKFGRESYVRVAPLAAIHDAVTDSGLSAAWAAHRGGRNAAAHRSGGGGIVIGVWIPGLDELARCLG